MLPSTTIFNVKSFCFQLWDPQLSVMRVWTASRSSSQWLWWISIEPASNFNINEEMSNGWFIYKTMHIHIPLWGYSRVHYCMQSMNAQSCYPSDIQFVKDPLEFVLVVTLYIVFGINFHQSFCFILIYHPLAMQLKTCFRDESSGYENK